MKMSSPAAPRTALALYRHLLRVVALLPQDAQAHYKHHIRQAYRVHADEDDSDRIQQIIKRSIEDSQWLLEKVLNTLCFLQLRSL